MFIGSKCKHDTECMSVGIKMNIFLCFGIYHLISVYYGTYKKRGWHILYNKTEGAEAEILKFFSYSSSVGKVNFRELEMLLNQNNFILSSSRTPTLFSKRMLYVQLKLRKS